MISIMSESSAAKKRSSIANLKIFNLQMTLMAVFPIVIDNAVPLLLYVGETKLSAHQRWTGTHDCKGYTMRYIEAHRRFELEVAVCAAFWVHVPSDKKILRQWERELIYKWCPPFNREMWEKFGQPFRKRTFRGEALRMLFFLKKSLVDNNHKNNYLT